MIRGNSRNNMFKVNLFTSFQVQLLARNKMHRSKFSSLKVLHEQRNNPAKLNNLSIGADDEISILHLKYNYFMYHERWICKI